MKVGHLPQITGPRPRLVNMCIQCVIGTIRHEISPHFQTQSERVVQKSDPVGVAGLYNTVRLPVEFLQDVDGGIVPRLIDWRHPHHHFVILVGIHQRLHYLQRPVDVGEVDGIVVLICNVPMSHPIC